MSWAILSCMARDATDRTRKEPSLLPSGGDPVSDDGATTAIALTGQKKNLLSREELLSLIGKAVRLTAQRTTAARFRPKAGDKDRLAYARALAQLASCAAAILKDEQLDDIERRLAALEEIDGKA